MNAKAKNVKMVCLENRVKELEKELNKVKSLALLFSYFFSQRSEGG